MIRSVIADEIASIFVTLLLREVPKDWKENVSRERGALAL
jgi:hypothetical protein